MKKIIFFLIGTVLSIGAWASPRSLQQAQELATKHVFSHAKYAHAPAAKAPLKHCYTAPQKNGSPAFYVFNRGTNSGFVIVSAESRTHTILGYSNSGQFDAATMPDNMRAWLEGYEEAISYAASLPERKAGQRPQRAPKTYTPIAPLCSTHWGQGFPYNLQCPEDNGELCVTGCVATAAAQIMKKHNYPSQGKGSNSYYWYRSENDSVWLSTDFNTTYNWSQMLDVYDDDATTTQKNAVAKLMSDCGVACYMNYGVNGSGAYSPYMLSAFIENFRYNAGIRTLYKDYMKEADFLDAVVEDLQAGRPVWFNGRTKSDEGHAFVCDGLDADGLVHINWGWYGYQDNYFRVSALDPEDQGIGGSSRNEAFTERVTAYTHIIPSEGGLYYPIITADSMYVNATRVGRSDTIRFDAEIFQNNSLCYWEGIMALQVYQNGSLYRTYSGNFDLNLYHSSYYYDVWFSQLFSDLPEGNYEIVPVTTSTSQYIDPTPVPIMVKYIGAYRCQMQVTSDSIFLNLPDQEIPEELEPTIPDPTEYDFTKLRGFCYPEEQENAYFWKIQMETEDFFESDASNQMIVMFGVTSSSEQAYVGSYLFDESELYSCAYVSIFVGNTNSYHRYSAEDGEVTFVYQAATDTYQIHYRFDIGATTFVGQVEIPSSGVQNWLQTYYEEEDDYYSDEIETRHTPYTALSTTKAMELIDANEVGWISSIPYVISGEISQMANTPQQIAQYKNCRLYISDGSTPLYAYNTKWLGNTNFVTGNEIEVGGEAVIVGHLKYHNASTKEIQSGYFCQYTAPGSSTPLIPIQYDAQNTDFIRNYDSLYIETITINDLAAFDMYGYDDESSIDLIVFPGEGLDDVTVGTYPFSESCAPHTAYAGAGLDEDNYFIGSLAYTWDEEGYIIAPVWYAVQGNLTIKADGTAEVNAINSYGRTIHCILGTSDAPSGIDSVRDSEDSVRKILRNGQMFIIRNGEIYTVSGEKISELK